MTKFRRVLQEKGYNGRTFAELSGLGRSVIYKYMCGSRKLSFKTAKRFASLLNVKVSDLLEEAVED